jgi:hypothetical protein
MPPKKGSKGSKKGSKKAAEEPEDADNFTTDDMKEMRTSLREMKASIINEKKLLNDFQQQKEKIEKYVLRLSCVLLIVKLSDFLLLCFFSVHLCGSSESLAPILIFTVGSGQWRKKNATT